MNRWNARLMLLFFVLASPAWIIVVPAIANESDDWSISLKQPPSGYYGPQDELRMGIPAQVPVEALQQLKLEVDGIDVTSFIELDAGDAVYKPVQPFAWGQHEAHVIEYTPEGEMIERGKWIFEVRKTNSLREASLNAELSLTGRERIAQRDKNDQLRPFGGNGSLTLNGSVANDGWQANANGQFVYLDPNSSDPNNPGGVGGAGKRSIDVGDFLLSAQGGPLTLRAGHHSIAGDNLLMQQGVSNRGASATLATDVLHSSATGFVMRSSPVTGFRHGFAISNPADRIEGVTVETYPLASETSTVKITGVYVLGNGGEGGDFVGGDSTTMGGDGVGGTIDSVFFSERLRLRGEYARTSFDFDGKTGSLAPISDHAYAALGTLKVLDGFSIASKPLDWTIGVQYRYFGLNYRSVADVGGGMLDTEAAQLVTSASWGDISLNGELNQAFDNVSNALDMAKNRSRFGTLTMGWNPKPDYDDQGRPVMGLLGAPSLSATISSQQLLTVLPGAVAAGKLDTLTNALSADAATTYTFKHTSWNWHFSYMVTWIGNHTDATGSTRTDAPSADMSFTALDQSLSITPRIELIREKNRGFNVDTKTVHPSLTTAVSLFDGRVSASVTGDVSRIFTNDITQDGTVWAVFGNLDWVAWKAAGLRPGLTLSLSGDYANVKDRISALQSFSNYQVFLNATINWNGGI